jgi:hypothetical protein
MNSVTGDYSVIPGGGYADTVASNYSFAAGYRVRLDTSATATFAFGREFSTSTADAVIFYNGLTSIHVGIQNTSPTHLLDVGTSGAYCDGGAWVDGSSRDFKENISDLQADVALRAVRELNPVTYCYKFDGEERVGFIAEELPDLVATEDRRGLSATEVVAVLTRVVQTQQELLEEQQQELDSLRKDLEAIKR